jgi:hypothetical protein
VAHRLPRSVPRTPEQWIREIDKAFEDAREAKAFGPLVGTKITDADLFHMAPDVCLKFRGMKVSKKERDRITKVALANYVVNSDPGSVEPAMAARRDAPDLKNPRLAFALCYVISHLALDLLDEQGAEPILNAYERHLGLLRD